MIDALSRREFFGLSRHPRVANLTLGARFCRNAGGRARWKRRFGSGI